MAEQRKRLSKKASKILFTIICEDSFEGKSIKTELPATRRISKAREGLWEYIRSELVRRSEEEYDLGTVSAAWYYNLRKIGSCLDQIDESGEGKVALEKLRTMERYVVNNLGDRLRGRGRAKGDEDGDVKLTSNQMMALSRQSTMDATANYSIDLVALNSREVKHERGSSNEEKGKMIEEKDRADGVEDTEMRDDERMENDLFDPLDRVEIPRVETSHGDFVDSPCGGVDLSMDPLPSRYNTAETTPISRNNSTMSVSGYDADNEKGLIKRRRKELKKRGDRERVVKIEDDEETQEAGIEKEEEEEEEEKEDEGTGENANDALDDEVEEEEEVEDEDEEREERVDGEERNEKMKMLDHLKGMIENLRDHIVSLRIIGAIDTVDMETLADSFENAGKSVINNKDI